jgi:hypothetical protein
MFASAPPPERGTPNLHPPLNIGFQIAEAGELQWTAVVQSSEFPLQAIGSQNENCFALPRLPTLRKFVKFGSLKIEEIRKLLHAQQFRAFAIHVAYGGCIPLKHEDFGALAPTGREMIVYQPDGDYQVVDVLQVARVQVLARNGGNRKLK